jgi:hypothetical protein
MMGGRRLGDACACLLLILLCLGMGLPHYLDGMTLTDEGFLAYGAVRVLDGQLPNRDFVSLQPPLSFYSVALVFELLGESLASMRALGLLLHTLIALLVYALARQLTRSLPALVVALPATMVGLPLFLFVPFAVWQGMALSLFAALLFMRAVANGAAGWGIAAGSVTALALLARHDQGLYLVVSLLAYAVFLRVADDRSGDPVAVSRLLGRWAVGFGAVVLPLASVWFLAGAASDMLEQLVVFPLTTYARTSSIPMPWFRASQHTGESLLVACFYLPPLVQGLTAVWLGATFVRGGFRKREATIAFVVIFAALFYLQVVTRSDVNHLLVTLAPFFALCGVWMGEAMERTSSRIGSLLGGESRRRDALLGAALVLACACGIGVWAGVQLRPHLSRSFDEPMATVSLPRAGIRLEEPRARALTQLVTIIGHQVPPDRSILCLPYQPMFYFLAERRNPTRWNYLWPGDQSESDHLALIEQARADPPGLVLLTSRQDLGRWAPEVVAYVDAEFDLEAQRGPLTIYRPR